MPTPLVFNLRVPLKKSTDRLVAFTDAVVAIAITLLVLPLVDLVAEGTRAHLTPQQVVSDNFWQLFSFVLSFVVIARLWLGHHALFEMIRGYNRPLVLLNLLWLLSIVLLPFPTEMSGGYRDNQFVAGLYIAVVLISDAALLGMQWIAYTNPEIAKAPGIISRAEMIDACLGTVIFLIAFLLAAFVPGVTFYGLLLLVVPGLYDTFRNRLIHRQSPPHEDDEPESATPTVGR